MMKVRLLLLVCFLIPNLSACLKLEMMTVIEPVANPRVVERVLDPEKAPVQRMYFDGFTEPNPQTSNVDGTLFKGLGKASAKPPVSGDRLEPVTAFVGFKGQTLSGDGSDVVEVFLQEVKRHPFINEHRYMLVAQSTESETASRMNSEIISALMSEGVASEQITAFTSDKNLTTAQGQGVKLLAIDVSDDPARYLN